MLTVMEMVMLAAGALAGSLVPIIYRRIMDSNIEILTPRAVKELGLPSGKREYSHIFTIKNENKRIAQAVALVEIINDREKGCARALSKKQDQMADLRRDLNRVQEKVRESDTKGEQEIIIHSELTPVLKKMGSALDGIASELNSSEMLESQSRFLDQVKNGFVRKQVRENLIKRGALTTEKDPKMREALDSAQSELSLGRNLYQETVEKWIEQI